MIARYQVPITRREASTFMRLYFGTPRFPVGSKFFWVAGVPFPPELPCYLIAGVGGLEGVIVLSPAREQSVTSREVAS